MGKFNKTKTSQPEPKSRDKFRPPNLPIAWLASTFVVPVLVVFIPYLIAKDEVDFVTCLSIGLTLACIMLFVFAFSLILRLYDSAFELQLLQRDVDSMENRVFKTKEESENLTLQAEELRKQGEELRELIISSDTKLRELESLVGSLQHKQQDNK